MAVSERRLALGLRVAIGPNLAAARVRNFLERLEKVQLVLRMFERDRRL